SFVFEVMATSLTSPLSLHDALPIFGALMTLGIGLYGPCMILVSLLGLTPTAAFPIMMGSCAFLMPVASARFIKLDRYDVRAALGDRKSTRLNSSHVATSYAVFRLKK